MKNTPSNMDDIIDSRDIIERIEELKSELEGATFDEETEIWTSEDGKTDMSDEAEELATLEGVAEEAEGYSPDWHHGETLIRDSYFVEYAQELAEDIGAVNSQAAWPNSCIDWEQAARELQMDYTSVDYDGVTYWTR